jgi:hypothetical protein
MKNRFLLTSAVILLSTMLSSAGQDEKRSEQTRFPKWACCIAYQVRDADKRDARPANPADLDPFAEDKKTQIPYHLLSERHIVDVAALSTRIVTSALLKHDTAVRVIHDVTKGSKRHPIMECYEPHHIFIFYNHEGQPVAAIEVCFSCNRVKMNPEIRDGQGVIGSFETSDLLDLAKIASTHGFALAPFDSLDAYAQRTKRLEEQMKKQAEPLSTPNQP